MADAPTGFFLREVSTRVGPLALVTMDNGEDWQKPNVFGRAAFASLVELLPRLQDESWSGLVLTGKPFVFAAGADLNEFPLVSTPELARAGAKAGHDAFGAIRDLPYPTLAAINGAALGGGLEIALHCDFRTLARSVRHLGFPEVFLGIVPAWGGTQLVPRVVGASAAVELIVANPLRQNRLTPAVKAAELGLVDALLDDVEFLDDSIEWLVRAIGEGLAPRPAADLSDAAEVCAKARYAVDDAVHGVALAPYRALELIAGAAQWTLEQGYAAEEDALAELLPGPQAQAGVYAFDLVERRIKRGAGIPDAKPRRIQSVGVVGAGLMATQLATLFLRRLEVPLVITDVDRGARGGGGRDDPR
jgi:enoyl-CoA hydratase/carnithine racemase